MGLFDKARTVEGDLSKVKEAGKTIKDGINRLDPNVVANVLEGSDDPGEWPDEGMDEAPEQGGAVGEDPGGQGVESAAAAEAAVKAAEEKAAAAEAAMKAAEEKAAAAEAAAKAAEERAAEEKAAAEKAEAERVAAEAAAKAAEENAAAEAVVAPVVIEVPQNTLRAGCSSMFDAPKQSKHSASTYDASTLLDGVLETAWSEGARGSGVGEWVEIQLPAAAAVDHVRVWNGYQKVKNDKFGDRFPINERVRELEVDPGTGEPFTLTLEDRKEPQDIPLNGTRTDRIRLTIRSVYPAKFKDTTLSEIRVFVRE
ncbi:MAG: hypothetical protein FJ098_06235 [Deltaproteobacteria bacterium]|nr:hypothetical protein [Deltaproteobacteria bacterium]